jgi:hypothetical protein
MIAVDIPWINRLSDGTMVARTPESFA